MSLQVCRNMAVSMLLLSLSLGLAFLQRLVSTPTIHCRAMILLLHDMAHELQGCSACQPCFDHATHITKGSELCPTALVLTLLA